MKLKGHHLIILALVVIAAWFIYKRMNSGG